MSDTRRVPRHGWGSKAWRGEDRAKAGTRIHDVPVLAGLDQAAELLGAHRVGEVIVASDKIPADRLRRLETICATRGVAVVRAAIRLE